MPFVKGENISPDSTMFIHGIDNNILNSGARFLRVYQEEYKMFALHEEINIFLGRNQNKN